MACIWYSFLSKPFSWPEPFVTVASKAWPGRAHRSEVCRHVLKMLAAWAARLKIEVQTFAPTEMFSKGRRRRIKLEIGFERAGLTFACPPIGRRITHGTRRLPTLLPGRCGRE